MVLFETRGLRLFSVIQGGIECQWRLCAEARDRLTWEWILTLEPRAPETSLATTKRKNRLHGRSVLGALKPAALDGPRQTLPSCFQTAKVTAAILRANCQPGHRRLLPLSDLGIIKLTERA